MPRRFWLRKDAYGGDTRRVGATNRFIRRFPNEVTHLRKRVTLSKNGSHRVYNFYNCYNDYNLYR